MSEIKDWQLYKTAEGDGFIGVAMDLPNGLTIFVTDWRDGVCNHHEPTPMMIELARAIKGLLLKIGNDRYSEYFHDLEPIK